MDYTVWGIGTALIGVACLLLGYLLGSGIPRHTRNSWAAPRTMEPIEAPEDGTNRPGHLARPGRDATERTNLVDALPTDRKITYERQYRKCGKISCQCRFATHPGHGPYWYAYWRDPNDNRKVKSRYVGKQAPERVGTDDVDSTR